MATALLIMHMQEGVVEPHGAKGMAAVEGCAKAIATARAHSIPVLYVRMAFREGLVDVQPRHRSNPFVSGFVETAPSAQIHRALRPEPDALQVVNKRASAFKGSDLEVLLRSLGCTHLVLAGIGTSGVVLATFIEAADLDYQLTVLSDACTDPYDEVHRVLCDKVFPMRGEVSSVSSWVANLGAPRLQHEEE